MCDYMTTYLDEVALFQSVERKRAQSSAYLDRPGQDYSNVTLFQEDVYDLTRAAEIALEAAGFPVPAKRRENHKNYQHEFMASCTAASTEIAVRNDQNLEWISQDAVIKNPRSKLRGIGGRKASDQKHAASCGEYVPREIQELAAKDHIKFREAAL